MIGRRGFLATLAAAVAGAGIDPATLLPAPSTALPPTLSRYVITGNVVRFDVLYGFATIRPEWACRVVSDDLDGLMLQPGDTVTIEGVYQVNPDPDVWEGEDA